MPPRRQRTSGPAAASSKSKDHQESQSPSRPTAAASSDPNPSPSAGRANQTSSTSVAKSGLRVAIPRIQTSANPDTLSAGSAREWDKSRVSHACEPCRRRKTKCSGERPICKHCQHHGITCVYADGKRDRAKKEVNNMASLIEDYEQLLRQVVSQVDKGTQIAIQALLTRTTSEDSFALKERLGSTSEGSDRPGENYMSARFGSTGSVDRVEDDIEKNENSRAMGYAGKSSDVSWMQRVEEHLEGQTSSTEQRDATPESMDVDNRGRRTVAEASYFLDDVPLDYFDDVDELDLPPKNTADALINVYFTTVHVAFPFFIKNAFLQQYTHHYQPYNMAPNRPWLAVLNLVFAISAKCSHLTKAEWRGDDRDHLVYLARARQLGLNDSVLVLGQPNLENIQSLALFTFYLMAIGQINRAWIMAGHAIRLAQSLGMHLLSASSEISAAQKEKSLRLWWAVYTLERLLCIMAGRSSAIADRDMSNSLPTLEEEALSPESRGTTQPSRPNFPQPTSTRSSSHEGSTQRESRSSLPASSTSPTSISRPSLSSSRSKSSSYSTYTLAERVKPATNASFFLQKIQLTILTHSIVEQLFSAKMVDQSWADVQSKTKGIDAKLKQWRSHLPSLFDFGKAQRDQKFYRQRMGLGFQYYSAQMILYRPCLCRMGQHMSRQSSKSKFLDHEGAVTCIQAARNTIALIPDEPNTTGLYSVAPWWAILHHLVQASAVLLLELSCGANHSAEKRPEILQAIKKVIRWLRSMSEENLAAWRAWHLIYNSLKRYAEHAGGDISDVVDQEPAIPHMYGSFRPTTDPTQPTSSYSRPDPNESGPTAQEQAMYLGPSFWSGYDDDSFMRQMNLPNPQPQHTPHTSFMFPSSSEMEDMAAATMGIEDQVMEYEHMEEASHGGTDSTLKDR